MPNLIIWQSALREKDDIMEYIISMGTNIGDRKKNIENAVEAINNIPYTDVLKASSIYETEPVGYARQDNFYNAVLHIKSKFDPHEMLGICLGIESGFGRVRTIKCGPRILDLDIIFADNLKIDTGNLTVPHPRFHERRFVLEPMLELFPDGYVFDIDFRAFLENTEDQEIEKIDIINPDLIAD